jgi:hypothetical protein
MLTERNFEDVLAKYPDLIEVGLRLTGRQVIVEGRRLDLLFEDSLLRRLLVELKWGPIKDQHVGQIMAYAGSLRSNDDPDLRVMLIGTRVPPSYQRSLDFHGIAWKEITRPTILAFVQEKQDSEFICLFADDVDLVPTPASVRRMPSTSNIARAVAPANLRAGGSLLDFDARTVVATQGSLNNTYIVVRRFIDWFESDVIGGHNKQNDAPRKLMVEWEGQPGLETDIDGHHKSLRNRSLVSRFMRDSGLVAGDQVEFRRLAPYRYKLGRVRSD